MTGNKKNSKNHGVTQKGKCEIADYGDGLYLKYGDEYFGINYRESDNAVMPVGGTDGGTTDNYSPDGITFVADGSSEISLWDINDLNGTWYNEAGEEITINAEAMTYVASYESSNGWSSSFNMGTIEDDGNGKGVYLSLKGYAYVCMGQDRNRFMLEFEAGENYGPDGNYTGIFYRDWNISEYVIQEEEKFFYNENELLCYTDGVETFVLPYGYELIDGWAVDSEGHMFGRRN